jgi:hypothetical protein
LEKGGFGSAKEGVADVEDEGGGSLVTGGGVGD